LSDYGIRSLSKIHQDNPYSFAYKDNSYNIQYEPGESSSSMFGGNSNWRGPIWLPFNYLIINSLRKYYEYYADDQSCWTEEHFKGHHLFYEFFHGDTGQGLGASHQTGWTALVINLLLEMDEEEDDNLPQG